MLERGVKRSFIAELTLREIREVILESAALVAKATSQESGQVPSVKSQMTVEKKRVVAVVDRGWIFAGDQSTTPDGYIRLDNAVHVFGWKEIGFTKMLEDWKSSKVDIRPCKPVEFPPDALVFRIPVEEGWGIQ